MKSIEDLARMFGPTIQGWMNYYCRFYPSAFRAVADHLNRSLARWACGSSRGYEVIGAVHFIGLDEWRTVSRDCSRTGGLALCRRLGQWEPRMSREVHVRF